MSRRIGFDLKRPAGYTLPMGSQAKQVFAIDLGLLRTAHPAQSERTVIISSRESAIRPPSQRRVRCRCAPLPLEPGRLVSWVLRPTRSDRSAGSPFSTWTRLASSTHNSRLVPHLRRCELATTRRERALPRPLNTAARLGRRSGRARRNPPEPGPRSLRKVTE